MINLERDGSLNFLTLMGGNMRVYKFVVASALVVMLAARSGGASAASLYVDPENGTDASNTTCGTSLATPSTGPCATLNNALAHASTGDSIYVERAGSFGPIYLTGQIAIIGTEEKSVTIVNNGSAPGCIGGAPGSCASASASNAGIEIVAGATDNIKLKNLLVNSGNSGVAAIKVQSAFAVSLNGVALRSSNNSSLAGLFYDTSNVPSSGSPHQIYIHGMDAGYNSSGGAVLFQPSVSSSLHISNSEIHHLKFGLKFLATSLSSGAINAVVDNTEFFSFNGAGVLVTASGAAPAMYRSIAAPYHKSGQRVCSPTARMRTSCCMRTSSHYLISVSNLVAAENTYIRLGITSSSSTAPPSAAEP